MSKPDITILGPADLRVKCLCGCGGIQTYEGVTLTLEAVFENFTEFENFVIRFSAYVHPHPHETFARAQVRGETRDTVFALPCIEYKPGGVWVSKPDRDGSHLAVKAKGTDKVVGTWQ